MEKLKKFNSNTIKSLLFLFLFLFSLSSYSSAQRDDDITFDQSSIDQRSEQKKLITHQQKVKSPGGWEIQSTKYEKTTDTVRVQAQKDSITVATKIKTEIPALMKWAKKAAGFLGNIFELAQQIIFGMPLNVYSSDHYAQIYPYIMGKYRYVESDRHAFLDIAVSGRKREYTQDDYFIYIYDVSSKSHIYYSSIDQAISSACKPNQIHSRPNIPNLTASRYSLSVYCVQKRKDRADNRYTVTVNLSQRIWLGSSKGYSNVNLPEQVAQLILSQGRLPSNAREEKAVADYKRFVVENEFYAGSLDKKLDTIKQNPPQQPAKSLNSITESATQQQLQPQEPTVLPALETVTNRIENIASSSLTNQLQAVNADSQHSDISLSKSTSKHQLHNSNRSDDIATDSIATEQDPVLKQQENTDKKQEHSKFELPEFCSWANSVCEFLEWVKKDDSNDELDELDIIDHAPTKTPNSFDVDYLNYGGQCPVFNEFSINLGFEAIRLRFDVSPLCDFALKVRPAVLAIAYLLAMMIVARAIQNT